MCTVTYFPYEDGYILTSNRDEHIARETAVLPEFEFVEGSKLVFPKDKLANGSWIMASDAGRLVCLLNGAFDQHERRNTYRKSRGIVLKESFGFDSVHEFSSHYELDDIEPFTIVWVEGGSRIGLHEFRWDGMQKHQKELPPDKAFIWSSATLYNPDQRAKRETWFQSWFGEDSDPSDPMKILDFHSSAGEEDKAFSLTMKRSSGVQTVSTTQVVTKSNVLRMYHNNLKDEISGSVELNLNRMYSNA